MPSKNVLKYDVADTYYHIYARGNNKMDIFIDDQDYLKFISLFKRYLSKKQARGANNQPYPHLYGLVEMICFCLMNNHFHMFIYQEQQGSMTKLMRALMTSYSKYFNTKYHRTGPLFETRYKAVEVLKSSYFEHITRYIHLNPQHWRTYPFSSISYYLDRHSVEWLKPDRALSLFRNPREYEKFLKDYVNQTEKLRKIKHQLEL